MPERKTRRQASRRTAPSSKAGEYVREEIHHVRQGKHGARSSKEAIAMGLNKARKAGVKLPPPPGKKKATAKSGKRPASATRSRGVKRALKREGRAAGSRSALSRQTRSSARKRGPAARSASARKAANTRARQSK